MSVEDEIRDAAAAVRDLMEDVRLLRTDVMRAISPLYLDINELRNAAQRERAERAARLEATDRHAGMVDAQLAALHADRMLIYRALTRLDAIDAWVRRPWWRRLRGA